MSDLNQYFRSCLLDFYFSIGRVSLDTKSVSYRLLLVLMTKFDKLAFNVKRAIGDDKARIDDKGDQKDSQESSDLEIGLKYFEFIYQFMIFVRDPVKGLGETTLAYMMIFIWYKYFPVHALSVLHLFPQWNPETFAIGSWRDIPYFCLFVRHFQGEACPLIDTCIGLMNHQLDVDSQSIGTDLSLVAKWIPRENSKVFGWLYDRFVVQWYKSFHPDYFPKLKEKNEAERLLESGKQTLDDNTRFEKAMRKARMNYRKIVSRLSRKLDTVQSNQCNQEWSKISPNSVSYTTLLKQKNAFLNIDSAGTSRKKTVQDPDRKTCKECFTAFYKGKSKVVEDDVVRKSVFYSTKHKGVYMGALVKDILSSGVANGGIEYPLRILDRVCCTMPVFTGALPILDLHCEMNDVCYDAIGIATCLARVSSLPNRIMTYGSETGLDGTGCSWLSGLHAENENGIVETMSQLNHLYSMARASSLSMVKENGMIDAVKLVVDVLVKSATNEEAVKEMVLVVLSSFKGGLKKVVEDHAHLSRIFTDAGFTTPPYIVYWNMSGSPGTAIQTGKNSKGGGVWTVHNSGDTGIHRGCLVAGATSTVLNALCKVDKWGNVDAFQIMENIICPSPS